MRYAVAATMLVAGIHVGAHVQPLQAQTRQGQVAAELARTAEGTIKACSVMTVAEIREITNLSDPLLFRDEPYDQGSLCDWDGIVTLRIFSGQKAEENVNWTLENYRIQDERHALSGFGTGAFIMFPKPRDQYQDTYALLVGRARQDMFMITVIAPDGASAESVRPQLEKLATLVIDRLR